MKITLGDITAAVVKKDVKNIHLSVYPPVGAVRISAPRRMKLDTIRVYAISKLAWIKQQQKKMRDQERETRREYLDRESHYLWGKRFLLEVIVKDATPEVRLTHNKLLLQVRPATLMQNRQAIIEEWYRERLKDAAHTLVKKWERLLGVKVERIFVQRMKTRWGSCSPKRGNIRLNTDLAKKPRECLEYIVVHEMIHLLEPTHNRHFIALMDSFMPKWQFYRDELNRLPVRHQNWQY